MKLQTRHSPAILAVLGMLLLSSLACSFSGVSLKDGNTDIHITVKENTINRMIEEDNHNDGDESLFKRITRVDLHDGYLTVFGVYDRPAGKGEAEGSYDATFHAENGALRGEITGVEIEGVSVSDKRVQRINDELAESLERSARESRGEVEFKSVTITEDALDLQVNVHWDVQ